MGTDAVNTDNVQNGSITEPKLANGSTSEDKIANGAVTTAKLANGSVTEPKIASSAVTESKINNGAVTESKIALNAVTSGKISSNAVTNAKIANGAVTRTKIGDGEVIGAKIADGSVSNSKITGLAVTSNKIATGAVTGVTIANGAVTSGKLASSVFGPGSNQAARGNHTHTINGSTSATSGASAGTAHTHNYVFRAGLANAPSTKRLKKEISDFFVEDPKRILNLQAKKYKYKNQLKSYHSSKNRQWLHGYMAEDVLEAGLEELVGYDEKGRAASLDYSLISLFLVELAKVHESEINSLKEEIQRLKEER
jgi:hypothetical protein